MPIQPPKSDAYPSTKPSPMRHLSEFAVADSPGASGPEQDYAADDEYDEYYLDSRFVSAHVNAAAAAAAAAASGDAAAGGGPGTGTALPEGEEGGGRGRDVQEGAEAGWRSGGLPSGGGSERTGASASASGGGGGGGGGGEGGGMPGAPERGARGGGTVMDEAAGRRATNVDAQGKMAPTYPEGQVAHAVEGARRDAERARAQAQAQGGGSSGAGGCPGCMHGRGRGEVTLQANEAGLERKKQQQAAARKQVVDARRRGEDVDGRGLGGPSGRQPRAEVD